MRCAERSRATASPPAPSPPRRARRASPRTPAGPRRRSCTGGAARRRGRSPAPGRPRLPADRRPAARGAGGAPRPRFRTPAGSAPGRPSSSRGSAPRSLRPGGPIRAGRGAAARAPPTSRHACPRDSAARRTAIAPVCGSRRSCGRWRGYRAPTRSSCRGRRRRPRAGYRRRTRGAAAPAGGGVEAREHAPARTS